MPHFIEILPSHKIDHAKWNDCVRFSSNGLIYANTYYLDHIADNWHGIVMNDYECVMPVVWRKKFGIRYAYNVPFVQQLGWFHQHSKPDAVELVKKLFSFCKYGDYAFNFYNSVQVDNASTATNYILELFQPFETFTKKYNTDLISNLKKAYKQELVYAKGEYNEAIDLYKKLYHERTPHVTDHDFENFRRLCEHLYKTGGVIVRNIFNANDELLAIALLLKDERRLYNLMNSTTEQGRKTEANHFLLHNIFKEFAESHLIFDFEGSDIPGVKNFYEKFGAKNQPYCKVHFNHLSAAVKWMKK